MSSKASVHWKELTWFLLIVVSFFYALPTNAFEPRKYPLSAEYAEDGVSLTTPFLIQSVATGKYLYQTRGGDDYRDVEVHDLIEDDDRFLWVFDGDAIANVDSGLYLIRKRKSNVVRMFASMGTQFGDWSILTTEYCKPDPYVRYRQDFDTCPAGKYVEKEISLTEFRKNPIVQRGVKLKNHSRYESGKTVDDREITVLTSDSHIRAIENPTNADSSADWTNKSTVWRIIPAKKRDLARITFHRIKAIQTSTGTDGATDDLFKAIEVTAAYGPDFLAAPAASLKVAAKEIAKKGGKELAKKGSRIAAAKLIAQESKKLAKRAVKSTPAYVGKYIKNYIPRKIQKLKDGIKSAAGMFKKKFPRPPKTFTEKLKQYGGYAWKVRGAVKTGYSVERKLDTPQKAIQSIRSAGSKLNYGVNRLFGSNSSDEDTEAVSPAGIEVAKAMIQVKTAGAVIESQGFKADVENCAKLGQEFPVFVEPMDVMTKDRLKNFSAQAKVINDAIHASGHKSSSKEPGQIVLNTILMNPGWLKDALSPVIDDTDDSLEIKMQGISVWPNGGHDHRDISKGETKDVRVEMIFDRQKGVDIGLIEYDYASSDDDLGHLRFSTRNLRKKESFESAFVHEKSEGSLYALDFTVEPIGLGKSRQELNNIEYEKACQRANLIHEEIERTQARLQQAQRLFAAEERVREALTKRFGDWAVTTYDNARQLTGNIEASCEDIDPADIAGDWRVGGYSDQALPSLDSTWRYRFNDDGTFITPNGFGTWHVGERFATVHYHEGAYAESQAFPKPYRRKDALDLANIDGYLLKGLKMVPDTRSEVVHKSDAAKAHEVTGFLKNDTISWRYVTGRGYRLNWESHSHVATVWKRKPGTRKGEGIFGLWVDTKGNQYYIRKGWVTYQSEISIFKLKQNPTCGLQLGFYNDSSDPSRTNWDSWTWRYFKNHPATHGSRTRLKPIGGREQFVPLRKHGERIRMFRFANDSNPWRSKALKSVFDFAGHPKTYRDPAEKVVHDRWQGTRIKIGNQFIPGKYDVTPELVTAKNGGPGLWLEKIVDSNSANEGSEKSINQAKKDLVGLWNYRPPEDHRSESYWAKDWLFTEDGLVIGGFGRGNLGDPIIGTWRYIGDRRFEVKTENTDKLVATYTIHLGLTKPGSEKFVGKFFFRYAEDRALTAGDKDIYTARKKNSSIVYAELKPEILQALEHARSSRKLATPEVEKSENPNSLTELRKRREAEVKKERESNIEYFAETWSPTAKDYLATSRNVSNAAKHRLETDAVCAVTGVYNDKHVIGKWKIGNYSERGNKLEPATSIEWNFLADGTLEGSIGQKKWKATWEAVEPKKFDDLHWGWTRSPYGNYCSVTIKLNDDAARYFELPEEANLRLFFHENGDKEFFVTNNSDELGIWGTQTADTKYSHYYDQRILNQAEVANLCVPEELRNTPLHSDHPIDVKLYGKIRPGSYYYRKPIIYKYNRSGTKATIQAPSSDGIYQGAKGDVFVVIHHHEHPHATTIPPNWQWDIKATALAAMNDELRKTEEKAEKLETDYSMLRGMYRRYTTEESLPADVKSKLKAYKASYNLAIAGIAELKKQLTTRVSEEDQRVQLLRKLGQDNQCVLSVRTDQDASKGRIESDEYVASVNYETTLSAQQIESGCSGHPRVFLDGGASEWTYRDERRRVTNTSSSPIFLYQVAESDSYYDFAGAYKPEGIPGAYTDQKPFVEIAPGETRFVQGKKFTVLDSENRCAAVIANDSKDYAHEIGDGSAPIADPEYLLPRQVANGCVKFSQIVSGELKSDYKQPPLKDNTILNTSIFAKPAFGRISNTGKEVLQVYSVSNMYEYDVKRPTLTLQPGEEKTISDYANRDYLVLSENGRAKDIERCVAFLPAEKLIERELSSDPAPYKYKAVASPASYSYEPLPDRVEPQDKNNLNRYQTRYGCGQFGKSISAPGTELHSNDFENKSTSEMTISWVSFYGYESEGYNESKPGNMVTLAPGEFVNIIGRDNDVYHIVDHTGECAAVVESEPAYRLNKDGRRQVTRHHFVDIDRLSGRDRGTYQSAAATYRDYVLRDKAQTDEIEQRVSQRKSEEARVTDQLARLNDVISKGECKIDDISDTLVLIAGMKGSWNVEYFVSGEKGKLDIRTDGQGNRDFFNHHVPRILSSHAWSISEDGEVEGSTPAGKFSSSLYARKGCRLTLPMQNEGVISQFPGQDEIRVVFSNGKVSEFFIQSEDAIEDEFETYRLNTFEMLATRASNHIGRIVDIDENKNQIEDGSGIGSKTGIEIFADESDSGDTVTYSLEDNADGLFVIDPASGLITVGKSLETVTDTDFSIKVIALSSDGSRTSRDFKIRLNRGISEITDTDDRENSVREGRVDAHTGLVLSATDDNPEDAVNWHLGDDAGGLFRIYNGVISSAVKLDYETATHHSIEVVATSSDGSSTSKRFEIEVLDDDEFDVGPIIDADESDNQVDEGAAIGTTVGITASASDLDGSYNTITYELTNETGYSHDAVNLFTIDSETGVVTVNGSIDREQAESYTLEIRATSEDKSVNWGRFKVAIIDVNDHAVSVPLDSNDDVNRVSEDASTGAEVGITVFASDDDTIDNVVSYQIIDDTGAFAIDGQTGVIVVGDNTQLDYESGSTYSLSVEARSEDGSTSQQVFDIELINEDDNPVSDIVDSDGNENSVDEKAEDGARVGITARAVDDDVDSAVHYFLTDDADGLFAIDEYSGVVTVAGLVDVEKASSHTIQVVAISTHPDEYNGSSHYGYEVNRFSGHSYVAFNNGYHRGTESNTMDFEITVNPVNEHSIRIDYTARVNIGAIDENADPGTPVGVTAVAIDDDSVDTISYQLVDDYNGLFEIDAHTGIITFAGGDLDYESLEWPSVSVLYTAWSSDGSTLENPQSATINVNDVNEYGIGEITDTNDNYDSVAEDAVSGTPVGITVFARDEDGTTNTVSYDVVDQYDNNLGYWDSPFQVDFQTGEVTVGPEDRLDYETDPSPIVRIRATSEDGSSSFADFVIELEDVFEKPRIINIFDDDPSDNAVKEDGAPGELVGITLFAEEVDVPDSEFTYIIVDEFGEQIFDGAFHLLEGNKIIVLDRNQLDFEYESNTSVFIRASTADGFSAQQQFNIELVKAVEVVDLWRDNPQDPRGNNDYSSVPDDEYYACEDANNYPDSPTYNNETAYYDCLDQHVAGNQNNDYQDNQGDDSGIGTPALTPTQIENGCDQRGSVVSEDSEYDALITITNTGNSTLNIYWIDFGGAEVELDSLAYPENIVEVGGVTEFTTRRRYRFAIVDDYGTCAGIVYPRESRNSYSLGLE